MWTILLFLFISVQGIQKRTIAGPASGDLTGSYPNPLIAPYGVGPVGPIGSASVIPVVSLDNIGFTGRIKNITSVPVTAASPTGLASGVLTGSYPNPSGLVSTGISNATRYRAIITPFADGRINTATSGDNSYIYAQVLNAYATNGLLTFSIISNTSSGWTPGLAYSAFCTDFSGTFAITFSVVVDGCSVINSHLVSNVGTIVSKRNFFDGSYQTLNLYFTVVLAQNDCIGLSIDEFCVIGGGTFTSQLRFSSILIG